MQGKVGWGGRGRGRRIGDGYGNKVRWAREWVEGVGVSLGL